MRLVVVIYLIIFLQSCSDGKKPVLGQTTWQYEQNAIFKDATKSPLTKRDLKDFEGLDFFPFDSTYVVKANIKRTPDSEWFKMKTTTNDFSEERVYGILTFKIKGQTYQLEVYQGNEASNIQGFEDYLFLPFLDNTNGDQSYGGGRYIDLRIPKGDTLIIDFNKAYNPYCVYNERYSCPIVPRVNYLNTSIEAGLKDYKKE